MKIFYNGQQAEKFKIFGDRIMAWFTFYVVFMDKSKFQIKESK